MRTAITITIACLSSICIQAQVDSVSTNSATNTTPAEIPKLLRPDTTTAKDLEQAGNPFERNENKVQKKGTEDESSSAKNSSEDYGFKNRVAFILGAGASYVFQDVYKDPVVDKGTGFVQIEKGRQLRPNLSLGISFTPFLTNSVRKVNVVDNGELKKLTLIDYYPRGISFALFINPVSLANTPNSSLANTVDLGMGLGWRSGPFSAYLTLEAFALRQPRKWFVAKYANNDKEYLVEDEVQASVDIADGTIFDKPVFVAVGFKVAYTFDLIQSFTKTTGTKIETTATPYEGR